MSGPVALVFALVFSAPGSADEGEIRGLVVNATRGGVPCPQTEVVLRVRVDGQFVPMAGTVTDAEGRFQFTDLPVGWDHLYLPGANRDEVHYPGARVHLTTTQPRAEVKLEVCDAIAFPSPLLIKRQEILIQPAAGALHVTESLLIDNPTSTTYVGRSNRPGVQPVTLTLAIPPEFERTTFHKEFFGRNFVLVDDKVATTIPWTPGERELTFTYVLRNEERYRVWQRPLDLPCRHLRVRVQHHNPDEVTCNLAAARGTVEGELAFESQGTTMPAGHVVRVELGRLPIHWTRYARWIALALLIGMIAAVSAIFSWKQRTVPAPAASPGADVSGKQRRSKRRGRLPGATGRKRRRRAA